MYISFFDFDPYHNSVIITANLNHNSISYQLSIMALIPFLSISVNFPCIK